MISAAAKPPTEETRQALFAADWSHNAVIQNVILQVQQAYYQYVTARALLEAQQASYQEAQTNLGSADEKHRAGVATIADVLQARTAVAQVKLTMESLRDRSRPRGASWPRPWGLPANTPYDVSFNKEDVAIQATTEAVDKFLKEAQAQRPDLAHPGGGRQGGRPFEESESRRIPGHHGERQRGPHVLLDNRDLYGNAWNAQVLLKVPIFTRLFAPVRRPTSQGGPGRGKRQAQERRADRRPGGLVQLLLSRPPEQQVASEELLKSATESQEVALGRWARPASEASSTCSPPGPPWRTPGPSASRPTATGPSLSPSSPTTPGLVSDG